jgi:hypothetical protein
MGKLTKLIIGWYDLIDPSKPPAPDNYRFEARQAEDTDVVIFVDKNRKAVTLKGAELENPEA